jgi:hypothetical protein
VLRTVLFEIALAGCLPPDEPAKKPTPTDPDLAELVADWRVRGHVLASSTSMSDADADQLIGRVVAIRAAGYTSPWHGTCDESSREKRKRSLVEVAADLEVNAPARQAAQQFGIAAEVDEFRLSCQGQSRIPPITIYVSGAHAMTCFSGVCYLLAR